MFYPTGSANSVVAAQPGWWVAWPGEGTDPLFYEAVIAWFLVIHVGDYTDREKFDPRIERSVGVDVYPITADGVVDNPPGLKGPDGTFSIAEKRVGMTEAEYVVEVKQPA